MNLRYPLLLAMALSLGLGLSACDDEGAEEVDVEEGAVEEDDDDG